MNKLGLIGYPLEHSFSKELFISKFNKESIKDFSYDLYPIKSLDELPHLLRKESELIGFNVTIPYKEVILSWLDELDPQAKAIGAVNTVLVKEDRSLKGFNTDVDGFRVSFVPLLESHHESALILGTGGASKAVTHVMQEQKMDFLLVSRTPMNSGQIGYDELTPELMGDHQVIINTTPVGMHPNESECPPLPYESITSGHLLYDLIYNPEETLFLKRGKANGAKTKSGLEMLHEQAEMAWKIWTASS